MPLFSIISGRNSLEFAPTIETYPHRHLNLMVTHQELFNLELDDSSLVEIIKFMQSEIEDGNWLKISLLSSMGRASARIGLIPLIKTIANEIDRFDEDEFDRAPIALERIMFWDESLSNQEVREIFNQTNLLEEIAAKLLSLMPILHSDLESTTARLLSRLILLLANLY